MIFLAIYIIGYFASLWAMHTFKNQLHINHYDPPHDGWYDDYDSNAQAYASMSFAWPLALIIVILSLIWKGLMFISKKLEK
jgi:hypothetical protein